MVNTNVNYNGLGLWFWQSCLRITQLTSFHFDFFTFLPFYFFTFLLTSFLFPLKPRLLPHKRWSFYPLNDGCLLCKVPAFTVLGIIPLTLGRHSFRLHSRCVLNTTQRYNISKSTLSTESSSVCTVCHANILLTSFQSMQSQYLILSTMAAVKPESPVW